MKLLPLIFLFISTIAFSQQLEKVDFRNVTAQLSIDSNAKKVKGKVVYDFEVLSAIDTIKIDAQQMIFSGMTINEKPVQFKYLGKQLLLFDGFVKGKNTLTFDYEATPKQTMYFIGSENLDNLQIWTQGQGKYTSHWFPSFDDVNEKVIFNLDVVFDKKYQVISNGVLVKKINAGNEILWQYRMKKPMSSYLLMLTIGKFQETKVVAKSGTPLYLYIEQEDAAKHEATYRYSKTIFDFLEKQIGVKYPWQVYKQIPVRDFLYAGMENTSATVFSRDFVVDDIGFSDKNYVNVNAHELAHQWFGDMVTAETSKHHWLQEGFATYYALLAEKRVFGEDYFYYKLYQTSLQLKEAAINDTIPLLSEKASSLTFYQKGAWALHVLRDGVGEKIFKKAVKNYLKKHAFQTVNTEDFLMEIKKLSKYDLNAFRKEWLQNAGFNSQKANELLLKNKNIKALFGIQELRGKPLKDKKVIFEKALQAAVYFPVKEAIVLQLENVPFEEKESLLQLAMQTNSIQVRQAVVKTMPKIPLDFKNDYSNLLNDKSYITQEIALNVYWSQFPDEQKNLLDKSKTWVGFNDKNLRILWLTLALGTKDYETQNKVTFYDELLDYCSPKYESSIRQNAIENLLFVSKNDKNVLPFLVNAATSHRWQVTKFARDKIRFLLKNKNHRAYFEELLPKLPVNEKNVLERILSEK